jgi:hypothetical protein
MEAGATDAALTHAARRAAEALDSEIQLRLQLEDVTRQLSMSQAGAYTRPLLSSNSAVSDSKEIPNTPGNPQTPPKHRINNP